MCILKRRWYSLIPFQALTCQLAVRSPIRPSDSFHRLLALLRSCVALFMFRLLCISNFFMCFSFRAQCNEGTRTATKHDHSGIRGCSRCEFDITSVERQQEENVLSHRARRCIESCICEQLMGIVHHAARIFTRNSAQRLRRGSNETFDGWLHRKSDSPKKSSHFSSSDPLSMFRTRRLLDSPLARVSSSFYLFSSYQELNATA